MGVSKEAIKTGLYNKKWFAGCSHEDYTLYAHYLLVESDYFIFKHPKVQVGGVLTFYLLHTFLTQSKNGLAVSPNKSRSVRVEKP